MKALRSLFLNFFWLGLITFGGGIAMLPIIKQTAMRQRWIEEKDWEEIITLSQLAPGAIAVNCANLIGYRYRGRLGGFLAVLGMILGPMMVITLLALGLESLLMMPWLQRALKGMLLVVFILIIYAMINLGRYAWKRWWMVPFSLLSFGVVYFQWLSPWMVFTLAIFAIVGWTALKDQP